MKKILFFLLCFFCVAASVSERCSETKIAPLPVPKQVRIESGIPRGKIWERLSGREKKLAFHLTEAARAARIILFHQTHRHGPVIKEMSQTALSKKNIDDTRGFLGEKGFPEFLIYAGKFLDRAGPYSSSNRKYILKEVRPEQIEELFELYSEVSPKVRGEAARLMTDADYEVQQYPESSEGIELTATGGNLYEKGITGEEVRQALKKTLKTDALLNCRVIRSKEDIQCEIQTVNTPGVVGAALREAVKSLEEAKKYASTPRQKAQIEATVRYFTDGKIEDFRQANIEWVKDRSDSPVDFMIGWVEVYEDWQAKIGSWESYVQIVDPQISRLAQGLAKHAQYFENSMPYGSFKKKFPKNYSPPAIMAYYFQELASYRSAGYNLPNFDDIRRDVGAKNVIRLPLPGEDADPAFQDMWREVLMEFSPAEKVDSLLASREKIWQTLVLLHEIIGHGSGSYDTAKYGKEEDPVSALGPLGSALEEQRADLAALVFIADPKLVEVGVFKSPKEAEQKKKALYDFYLADFLRRTSGQRSFAEAHQRGHLLFINDLLEKGAIEWASKDEKQIDRENQVLVVKNYDLFRTSAKDLLGTLQKIKATRDEMALKEIFSKYASLDDINTAWAQAIIRRGKDLKINAGYVEQPWKITPDGKYELYGGKTLESIAPFWKIFY